VRCLTVTTSLSH